MLSTRFHPLDDRVADRNIGANIRVFPDRQLARPSARGRHPRHVHWERYCAFARELSGARSVSTVDLPSPASPTRSRPKWRAKRSSSGGAVRPGRRPGAAASLSQASQEPARDPRGSRRKAADGIAAVPVRPFADPNPFAELTFATPLKARFAISEELRLPLGGLCEEDRALIDALLARTLSKPEVMDEIRRRFPLGHGRSG